MGVATGRYPAVALRWLKFYIFAESLKYFYADIIQHFVPSAVSTLFIDAPRYISVTSVLSLFNLNTYLIPLIFSLMLPIFPINRQHNIITFRVILCHLVLLPVGSIHRCTLLWKSNQCPSVLLLVWIRMLRLMTLAHIMPFLQSSMCLLLLQILVLQMSKYFICKVLLDMHYVYHRPVYQARLMLR